MEFISVGIGGFIGANARYIIAGRITRWAIEALNLSVPVGTAFVNITGSFLLALFAIWATNKVVLPSHLSLLIITGFFGAYTTFSTYANESITLIRSGNWTGGLAIIIGTNLLSLLGVILGIALANRLWPNP